MSSNQKIKKKRYVSNQMEMMRAFCYFVEERNVRKTAARMGISPASVSTYINTLEEVIKRKLLDRKTRETFDLTYFGQYVYETAKNIIKETDSVFDNASEENEDNIIKIACHPLVKDVLLDNAIAKMQKNEQYSKLKYEIKYHQPSDLKQLFKECKVDMAIYPLSDQMIEYMNCGHLNWKKLWEYKSCIFADKRHKIAKKAGKDITLEDALSKGSVGFKGAKALQNVITSEVDMNFNYDDIAAGIVNNIGFSPMDELFEISLEKQKPNWKDSIVKIKTYHLVLNVSFQIAVSKYGNDSANALQDLCLAFAH